MSYGAPRLYVTSVPQSENLFTAVAKLEHYGENYGADVARHLMEHSSDKLASRTNPCASTEGISVKVRCGILRGLHECVKQDLARRHEFAFERVGFISAKLGNRETDDPLVLFTDYQPVADENYIDDRRSGARINSSAIRAAMQLVLDTGDGLFHVHSHAHRGKPGFSSMDLDETPGIVSSLRIAAPDQPHGMLLLSNDHCTAYVWMPGSEEPLVADRITFVGFPLTILT